MKAIIQDRYGDSGVLRLAEVPDPVVTPGHVVLGVKAAGVNMADWHLMAGDPKLVRLALGFGGPSKSPIRGQDVAGVVEAVGDGITGLRVGDEVFGAARGSFAERVLAKAADLVAKPAGVSWEAAGGATMPAYTALQALRRAGDLSGRRVVVTGAGGGVGSFVVQLAHARGAHVTAVCSAGKADFVRGLGADAVIDYRVTDVTAGDERFDVVIDFAGGAPIRDWRRVMTRGGVLVLGGDEQRGGTLLGPIPRGIAAGFARGIRAGLLMADVTPEDLAETARLLESGDLRVPVARSYALADAPRAIDDLRAARYAGKLVVVP